MWRKYMKEDQMEDQQPEGNQKWLI
jgi:hypothetical protein